MFNGCLKRVFIFFNLLCAIFGGMVICGMVKISGNDEFSEVRVLDLICSWGAAIAMTGIPSLGIYAALSKNICALKTFAGFMGAEMILMLILGFHMSTKGNEMKEVVYITYRDYVDYFMEDERSRRFLTILQESGKCCGFMGAEDWGHNIPWSCACYGSSKCTSRPYGTTGPYQIYAQGCMEGIYPYVDMALKMAVYMFIGFSAIALLGLLISLSMIHQIQRPEG
ncbi:23 kDa integral membrane protein-like isoform X2 [Mugil cephalus]|uniref:23 kDa integral membrane protein-like isoform X2 n=1 Tax=Mugil cephalus TaxID=48193 RepID=UPI001FB7D3F4|nr:23 kDa integral membrane protein-like isoform X2 [Mugil cephalus]